MLSTLIGTMIMVGSLSLPLEAGQVPHNGSPVSAPPGFDCALAQLQLEFAAKAQPFRRRADFVALANALQLGVGGCPPAKLPPPTRSDREGGNRRRSSVGNGAVASRVIVDCKHGDDEHGMGTNGQPLLSLHAAVLVARRTHGPVEIEVNGVCFLAETLHLNASDIGLTIRGSTSGATLVGGQPLQFSGPWRRSKHAPSAATTGTHWLRSIVPGTEPVHARALRFDGGQAAILARYPNANPERQIFPSGWIATPGARWLPPNHTADGPTLSAIESRPEYVRNDTLGIQDRWMMGVGGRCSDMEPQCGYWCIDDPSGWMGAGDVHRHPVGVTYYNDKTTGATSLLPHAPYADTSVLRLTAFSTGDHWFTWSWDQIAEQVDALGNHTLMFGRGGNQGAEGFDSAAEWYIEGPLEELDAPLEFAIANGTLHFIVNGTGPPPERPPFGWVVPSLTTMINISGSAKSPVLNISLVNLTIRDAADGWFAPHSMPSGGDWAITTQGAVNLHGTESVIIDTVNFTRCGGNGVFLSGYNKGAVIQRCSFENLGASAIASVGHSRPAASAPSAKPGLGEASEYIWQVGALREGGDVGLCANCTVAMAEMACTNVTDCRGFTFRGGEKLPKDALAKVYLKAETASNIDPAWQTYLRQPPFPQKPMPTLPPGVGVDATVGHYPHDTRISDVWVSNIGLLQKQSSAYFHAVSCCALVERMVAFNLPRAAININDGAGGNLTIRDSLLTNSCRESNDHGPVNSWDRIPYSTTVRDGTTASITPGWISVTRNLIIANYNAGWAVDNDDGSSYWNITENVLAFGHSSGLKSDFGGHDLQHRRNLYLFPASCAVLALGMDSFFMAGHECVFAENTCVLGSSVSYAGAFPCRNATTTEVHAGGGYTYTAGSLVTGSSGRNSSAAVLTIEQAKHSCNQSQTCFGFSYRGLKHTNDSVMIFFKPCAPLEHRRKCDWSIAEGTTGTWSSWSKGPRETTPIMYGNKILSDAADPSALQITCHNDTSRTAYVPHTHYNLVEWQALGHNVGDTVAQTPSNDALISSARQLLSM